MKKSTLGAIIAAVTISAVGLGVVAPVFAHDGSGGGMGRGPGFNFEELDANADGKLTPQEMADHKAAMFAAHDLNSDGFLSPEELAEAAIARVQTNMDARITRMIEKRDTDGDGQISLAEMSGNDRTEHMFKRLDTDGDGAISQDEMAAMKKGFGHSKRHGASE